MMVKNLRGYLATIGISMIDFCKIIGCSPNYMSQISNGKKNASPRLAKDVREATNGLVELRVKTEPRKKRESKKKEKINEG